MSLSDKNRKHIEGIADETLATFRKVADTARATLRNWQPPGPEVFANPNTFTSTKATQNLAAIHEARRESIQHLATEPAIARVVAATGKGNKSTFYICRAGTELGMVSYLAPVGRLASIPVGESLSLPNGSYEVLENARLFPALLEKGWDSRNSILEGPNYGPVTVASFLALLAGIPDVDKDVLERLLAEERESANVYEGLRRSVITKMGLRDQPVLDKYQDEIFRLPLSSRLLILGSPGTGKTTTLIRRLGQKLDSEFLEEDERNIVNAMNTAGSDPHRQSWMLFTPTELLKQYVKEAFARENIPASDLRIATWPDHRRQLARNVFGVLRTPSSRGTFVLKEAAASLAADTEERLIALFDDFNAWNATTFIDDIRVAAHELSKDLETQIANLGERLLAILKGARPDTLTSTFVALNAEVEAVHSLVSELKNETDRRIREALNIQVNRNNSFLDELAEYIDNLREAQSDEEEDQDDDEADDDEDTSQPKTGRAAAAVAFMRAVRAQARARARKRTLRKASRIGKIADWLGDRTLREADHVDVGAKLLVQSRARRFVNPVRRFLAGIPRRYRAFRRERQSGNRWYAQAGFIATDLHPLELDVILLAILRGASALLTVPTIVRDLDKAVWSGLRPTYALYRNQVLVDEAPDFSPVQIACMAALAHPRINSFFACGDFNQRLTTWGSRSLDEIKWALPTIDTKVIKVSYRHTRQLNEMARAIVRTAGGADVEVVLPEHVDNEGVPAVLLENAPRRADEIQWLQDRIIEIESFVQQLPSVAILVNSEEEVQQVAEELNSALASQNIRVVPCPNGQVMGQDSDVRVFDVQHIKGLEFEAAFFVGIDRLALAHPKLFDKYLYVGTTRAATYLGLTCEGKLPDKVSALRPLFSSNWKRPSSNPT
jgi:hypothetical protein